ncbi:large conductance mechanosensitive channel protein MscL [Corynebacterium marinum]|uniref:Large-conductance mechanosensitive channel n=2 Tax=Corynebacterium marinum TaxID=349751 RepID=A0A0B6TRX8_9CORY|nr:large conductance mechanosensitive channel protein MscL [Corynebacterium marinum]AJK68310.1 large-conductance mechanosensitive channel [Corynebacterium marinum DSM 44953]NLF90170.1 large conductance mechanosensitive channel protein MscL [Corynebacterium marinum]GGO15891.1 large conductance mechanosensitive channel protein MscL [Corynebacterium marinum]
MLQGFKEFIMRGNVIDLAVAVVIGGAFTAIVTAFSDNLINPLIAALGGSDVSGLGFHVISDNPATFLDFGAVITAAINFLLIAAVVYFVIVAPMNKLNEIAARKRGIPQDEEEPVPADVELLTEIRDLLSTRQA